MTRKQFDKWMKTIDPYHIGYDYIVNHAPGGLGDFPCYVTRGRAFNTLKTKKDILKYVDYIISQSRKGILVFSTTERDEHHKLWLEAMKEYEEVTITECESRNHGTYKCWMICIPLHP